MMISVSFSLDSKNRYFPKTTKNEQFDVFLIPVKMYHYWTNNQKLKIKGVKKIVIQLTEELDDTFFLPPGSELGAITVLTVRFDFQHCLSLNHVKDKRSYFIQNYQQAILQLSNRLEWSKEVSEIFKESFSKTMACVESDVYPIDFDPQKIIN